MIHSLRIADQLIEFAVAGKVDKGDWEKLTSAVTETLEHYDKVSICADLSHMDSMTGGAIYEDAKVSIRNLGNLDRLHKVAVVTAQGWVRKAVEISEKLVPGVEVQVFAAKEADDAQRWATTD